MPQFEVTKKEWAIAHQYLDHVPDGTKLPYSAELNSENEIILRKKFETNLKPYQTFHSFMKKDGTIFVFQRGELGEGSANEAKYVMNEEGELFVAKVGDDQQKLKKVKQPYYPTCNYRTAFSHVLIMTNIMFSCPH